MQEHYKLWKGWVKKGDLCFDIGASPDTTSVFLEMGAKKVISVEPDPCNFNCLEKAFRDNSNVVLVNAAVGRKSGIQEFFVCATRHSLSTMSSAWIKRTKKWTPTAEWNEAITVRVTTLDKIIAEFGVPDVCKIDTEGYDQEVLAGLTHSIEHISFEFTTDFFEEGIMPCVSEVERIGRYKYNYARHQSSIMALVDFVDANALLETLKTPDIFGGDVYAIRVQ